MWTHRDSINPTQMESVLSWFLDWFSNRPRIITIHVCNVPHLVSSMTWHLIGAQCLFTLFHLLHKQGRQGDSYTKKYACRFIAANKCSDVNVNSTPNFRPATRKSPVSHPRKRCWWVDINYNSVRNCQMAKLLLCVFQRTLQLAIFSSTQNCDLRG